jgi:hypothetical protein
VCEFVFVRFRHVSLQTSWNFALCVCFYSEHLCMGVVTTIATTTIIVLTGIYQRRCVLCETNFPTFCVHGVSLSYFVTN